MNSSITDYVGLGVIAVLTLDKVLPSIVSTVRKLKAPTSLAAVAADIADIKAGVGLVGIAITEAKAQAASVPIA